LHKLIIDIDFILAAGEGTIGGFKPLTWKDVLNIYECAL
jgi:hypothetical protein